MFVINYQNFDFKWHPESWKGRYVHCFGDQHSDDANTYLVPRDCDLDNVKVEYHNHAFQRVKPWNRFNISGLKTVDSDTDWYWIISDQNDYTDFDFTWHPESWQTKYVHCFGDQHADDSNTYLVHKSHDITNIRWQYHPNAVTRTAKFDILEYNNELNHHAEAKTEWYWLTSKENDYTDFDFHWQPVPWEADQIHCWASGDCQYGDTFLVPVAAFKRQADDLKVLGWYEHINWHSNGVPRPTLGNMYEWYRYSNARFEFYPNLWEKRILHSFGTNGSVLLVPRDCKQHFRTQYYDYPYILRHTDYKVDEKTQDVVFISYDEKNADLNYDICLLYTSDAADE